MLRKLHDLIGYKIEGSDETIGSVDDFYFDDHSWTVRYIVVDTGPWLVGRRVLISTEALKAIDSLAEHVVLDLTKEQIENSPSIDTEQPVSREHEIKLHEHYGWPGYWTVSPLAGMPVINPAMTPVGAGIATPTAEMQTTGVQSAEITEEEVDGEQSLKSERNLRSVREVTGYHLHATDGDIGHVKDIFAGENDWIIRYFLVDTRNWWPGKQVLVATDWAQSIDWTDRSITFDITQQEIKDSPEYNPKTPFAREHEHALYEHYEYPGYWL